MKNEAQQVTDLIRTPLSQEGLIVEDVKAHAAGQYRKVTVVIDLDTDTSDPVSLDTIAQATKIVSELIDGVELFNDKPYDLEVTSPGATRELTEKRHFLRNRGRNLDVRTNGPAYTGELVDVTDNGITLVDSKKVDYVIPFSDITKAKVVLRFR